MRGFIRLLYCLFLACASITEALPQSGSCVEFRFALQSDNKTIDIIQILRVIRHEAEVYQEAGGSLVLTRLPFDEPVEPILVSEAGDRGRIQVRKIGSTGALGWMKREDLLCRVSPLVDKKDLERKLFIKTPPAKSGTSVSVPAYPFPQGIECANRCKPLSRFELYFVFAEDLESKRYLLGNRYRLSDEPGLLTGWVDIDAGIPWNTTLGLRPSEDKGVQIRLTPTLQDAAEQKGVIILGGKEWYKYSIHIPVLGLELYKEKQYFHIAAPGLGARSDNSASNPQQAFEGFHNPKQIEELRHSDIFFLLDGTASMEGSISAVTKAAVEIVKAFSTTANYKESSARFGFRVYRDAYAGGEHGIGEGLPLGTDCSPTQDAMRTNQSKFNAEISRVRVSTDDQTKNDGYPENLFYGLRQAVRDIASCPQRKKLLFVIGDAGDNDVKVPDDVVRTLRAFPQPIVLFFIQTSNREQQARTPQAYRVAYDRFSDQALEILDKVLPQRGLDNKPVGRRDQFLTSLGEREIVNRIMEQVKFYSSSAEVNTLLVALQGGEALESYIRKRMAEGDLPVLYWELVRGACGELGKQCTEQIDHRVTGGYTLTSEPWVQELWINSTDLDRWIALLRQLIELIDQMGTRLSEQKDRFAELLGEKVQQMVGQPPIKDSGQSLEDYVKRKGGLPVRSFSPLLQYELHEIRTMESCELRRLSSWIRSTRDILGQIRAEGTLRVNAVQEDYPTEQCPSISDKGKRIRRVDLKQPSKLGEDDSYRYDHALRGTTIYWIPEEFFP